MNQYLLLRDNKQSGPYTMDELVAKGLKPYDLVWIEGKSAAWRYPSEITELKPYAPAVEEQPYDRFYKRPSAETQQEMTAKKTTADIPAYRASYTAGTTQTAKQPETRLKAIHPKKIYVTLPAGAAQTRPEVQQENDPSPDVSFSQKIGSTIGGSAAVAGGVNETATPVVAMNSNTASTRHITADTETTLSDTLEQLNMPAVGHRSRARIMTGLVAACLLLFGVVIGLAISNYRQSTQSKALEDLVRNIQEREKNKQVNPPAQQTIPPPLDFTGNDPATDGKPEAAEEIKETSKEVPVTVAARKERVTPPVKDNHLPAAMPTGHTAGEPDMKANTAVLEVQKEDRPSYHQAAIESARKNIHQLLLVESSKFKTGLLGGISDLRLTLSNNSRFPLDEVEVEVRYFGPESKVVKTQKLLFNDLAPGEQKTLEAPKTNRGVSIEYAITRINSRVLGLAHVRTEFHN